MIDTHLNQEQFNSHIHQTLTDAQRETMDQHLATCPHCRARLADHEALQRRIRHNLLADLRAVRPSPRMNYAAIEPRLKSPKKLALAWIQSHQLFSGAAALVTLALQAVVLLILLGSISQPAAGSTLAAGNPLSAAWSPTGIYTQATALIGMSRDPITGTCGGELLPGWFAAADQVCDYEIGVDRTVAHGGQASGYVKSNVSEPTGSGALTQMFRADDYRGQRLCMSGYAKTEAVQGWASLRVRVDGPGRQVLRFDEQPLVSTTGWERYEVCLDAPENGVNVVFGIALEGTGQVWVDDLQFQVLD
jgi:hypothetical protein